MPTARLIMQTNQLLPTDCYSSTFD